MRLCVDKSKASLYGIPLYWPITVADVTWSYWVLRRPNTYCVISKSLGPAYVMCVHTSGFSRIRVIGWHTSGFSGITVYRGWTDCKNRIDFCESVINIYSMCCLNGIALATVHVSHLLWKPTKYTVQNINLKHYAVPNP